MAKLGLMTETEIVAVNNFEVCEEVSVDAMAWSWALAGKFVALGLTGAFL